MLLTCANPPPHDPHPGFLGVLLRHELPQSDQHLHAAGSRQAGVSALLLDALDSGGPPEQLHLDLRLLTLTLSPVQQVRQQHPGVKVKYLAAYCFSGTYILTLLTEGYNFTSESYSSIKFIKKVGGGATHTHTHQQSSLPTPLAGVVRSLPVSCC